MKLTNTDMLNIALQKDLTTYENLNLLLDVLRVYKIKDKASVSAAKLGYEKADKQTVICTMRKNIKQALKFKELAKMFAFFASTDDFDMYMIACEWNREPQAKFWIPRREVLEDKHKIATQIQEFIDDDNALFLSISVAPGTGKTTLIKFLLAYISGKFPKSANMYISYSDGMVKMIYDSEVSILTDSSEYAHNEIFFNGPPKLSAEYSTISYRNKGDFPTMGIISLGGSVTGRTRANKFMITDDLVKNAEVARSPHRLETLYQDYKGTVTTRCIGDKVKQIMLGTIWSIHDPICRMLKEHEGDNRYRGIRIPVWDEDHNSNFEYRHPDNYTNAKIEDIRKDIDEVTFSCLYMQQPIEREGLLFKERELNWYNGKLPEGGLTRKIAVCDVAWGGGDNLSMPFFYVYNDGTIYVHDVIYNKGDKSVTQPIVIAKTKQHMPHQEHYEANNGGSEYADTIDGVLSKQNIHVNISHKKAPNTQSKVSRIIQFSPEIKKIYFRSDKARGQEYDKFIFDLLAFNQNGKNSHDDAPDSLALFIAFYANHRNSFEIFRRPF